ncbi:MULTISPECIES: hypothetical protein [Metallosphaera]|uniref:Protein NO VEIN C-terminal domain-containing protein n=3 Tax=Metallosphaera TaxID=41980 RepID=A4YEH5_METS5|nr:MULTISPECIES: hypothetical protein [Metallosphaera]ABP94827.1 hypothetical protein Msed_0652 [Metallosphaera sedula DSM 5348]AIM26814.1 hypothetical protein HA72_0652 [Metallosphaera sedula]AKV73763.1 hypothetical protein MsedA_0665 [Metallosphaera sedula]AKV76003.1 hypothetical protein MsedB_0665 [Metallosphaera sedula]AKV78254.1 hypothetical protein MsedC_0664 [Metallosphaera sedula]
MDALQLLKDEYGFTDDELQYAVNRAKGIIMGFAMEYRARIVLESMNFVNIRSVDLPTHDIEAERDGNKYFVEVKASKRSPTKEYSAYKLAMIARLAGTHLTLLMMPRPSLVVTEDILSEPKKILLNFFRLALNKRTDELRKFLEDERNRKIIQSYDRVILSTLHENIENLSVQ